MTKALEGKDGLAVSFVGQGGGVILAIFCTARSPTQKARRVSEARTAGPGRPVFTTGRVAVYLIKAVWGLMSSLLEMRVKPMPGEDRLRVL